MWAFAGRSFHPPAPGPDKLQTAPLPLPRPRLQFIHRLDVGINRGAEGKSGKAFVAEMTEDKAMALASKVVSEGFIYMVGPCCCLGRI